MFEKKNLNFSTQLNLSFIKRMASNEDEDIIKAETDPKEISEIISERLLEKIKKTLSI